MAANHGILTTPLAWFLLNPTQRGLEGSASVTVRRHVSLSSDISYVQRGTMTPRAALGVTAENLAETPPLRARLRARVDDGRLFAEVEGVANLLDSYFVKHLSFQRDPFRSGVRVAEPGRNIFVNAKWKF
ncbi:MAG: hypothetical protein ABI880_10155 [Acidobacteriota bacterium]